MSKILVVEDDADSRLGLCLRLKAAGYETCMAGDGLGATMTATKERPDLILLDLGLPAGDGLAVLERLKKNNATAAIPVIVVSARDPAVHKPKALAAGAVAFFQKPASNTELLHGIEKALGGAPAPAAAAPAGKKKVLVIEDDADTRTALQVRLRAAGYEAAFAQDAISAMSVALREKPDAIVMDLLLPGGDGWQLMDRFTNHPQLALVPVIVVSGKDVNKNRTKALEKGAAGFFPKPTPVDELLACIAQNVKG